VRQLHDVAMQRTTRHLLALCGDEALQACRGCPTLTCLRRRLVQRTRHPLSCHLLLHALPSIQKRRSSSRYLQLARAKEAGEPIRTCAKERRQHGKESTLPRGVVQEALSTLRKARSECSRSKIRTGAQAQPTHASRQTEATPRDLISEHALVATLVGVLAPVLT
jgi:hypothetical protein